MRRKFFKMTLIASVLALASELYAVQSLSLLKLVVPTAYTLDANKIEVEPSLGVNWGIDGSTRSTMFSNRLTWGVAPGFEFGSKFNLYSDGSQDYNFGVKWMPVTNSKMALSLAGEGYLPSGSNLVGWQIGPVYSINFTDKFSMDTSAVFALTEEDSSGGNYNVTANAGVGYMITPTIQPCIEVQYTYDITNDTNTVFAFAGLTWGLNDSVVLILGHGIDVMNPDVNFSFLASTIAFK